MDYKIGWLVEAWKMQNPDEANADTMLNVLRKLDANAIAE